MGQITNLGEGKGRKKRVNVSLDGKFAFSLGAEVAAQKGLQVGQELSADQIEALANSDHFQRCLDAAIHYLGYRPRSEFELRRRLHQRGFTENDIEAVLTRLKEQGLVDDVAFARFWKDNRESFSPRSRWLARMELRRKGVADDIIDQVVDTVDDGDSAYRAALSKARSLSRFDYQSFRRQLGGHLRRRGFDYRVVSHTVERVWQEQGRK